MSQEQCFSKSYCPLLVTKMSQHQNAQEVWAAWSWSLCTGSDGGQCMWKERMCPRHLFQSWKKMITMGYMLFCPQKLLKNVCCCNWWVAVSRSGTKGGKVWISKQTLWCCSFRPSLPSLSLIKWGNLWWYRFSSRASHTQVILPHGYWGWYFNGLKSFH